MRAILQRKKLWQLVIGKKTRPTDAEKGEIWDEEASMAAGHIFLSVQLDQRVHLNSIAEDPVQNSKQFICKNALEHTSMHMITFLRSRCHKTSHYSHS